MIEKTYDEKREIAKKAYKQINDVIESFEDLDIDFCAHWDGCISVGGEFFFERHLVDDDL